MKPNTRLITEIKKEIQRRGYTFEPLIGVIIRAMRDSGMPLEVGLAIMKHPEIIWEFKDGEVWFSSAKKIQ